MYPWNFVRTNTIFGVIHAAGGYTAWSDKHPAYSSVSGPGDGTNLDDFYAPEINSEAVALKGVTTPLGLACDPIPDPGADLSAWTNSFLNIQCYDTLKVNAILNEIDGYSHDRKRKTKVPTIFGMNFQAVSVGQKLIEANAGRWFIRTDGTPSASCSKRFSSLTQPSENGLRSSKSRVYWTRRSSSLRQSTVRVQSILNATLGLPRPGR